MSYWHENLTIGNVSFPRFMGAPLDGVTDSPMRQLVREFSPDVLLFTEMRHVACVANSKKDHSLRFKKIERPLAFQYSANRLDFIDKAIERVLETGIEMVNLNLGCPARCVIRSGSGSALMANPEQLTAITKEFMRVLAGRVPYTVKIRSGFKDVNAVEIAKLCEGLGAEMLIIHPRTQPQGFTGLPDVNITRQVKEAIKIPVIFSGNINSFKRAKKVYDQTGVDGFMIGRAMWGCPWKIRQIMDQVEEKEFIVPQKETLTWAAAHLDRNIEHYGPVGFQMFKKQLPVYVKGLPEAAQWRKKLLNMRCGDEMKATIAQLVQKFGE